MWGWVGNVPCFTALLDAHVQALPAQRFQQPARGTHAGEVLGRVHGEEVGDDVRDGGVFGPGRHARGVDADEREFQPVLPWVAAAEVGEDEEGACDAVLVLGLVGRCHQRAHEAARGRAVGMRLRDFGLVFGAVFVEERAVEG